jgi:hypothetical protein
MYGMIGGLKFTTILTDIVSSHAPDFTPCPYP